MRARTPHWGSESSAAAVCGWVQTWERGREGAHQRDFSEEYSVKQKNSHYRRLQIWRSEPSRVFVCNIKATPCTQQPITQRIWWYLEHEKHLHRNFSSCFEFLNAHYPTILCFLKKIFLLLPMWNKRLQVTNHMYWTHTTAFHNLASCRHNTLVFWSAIRNWKKYSLTFNRDRPDRWCCILIHLLSIHQ